MLGLDKNIVKLVPYDPSWKEEYKKEAIILKNLLGDLALDIQHVGSTSIPGISAKPILDIAVAVKNLQTLYSLIPIFTTAGYDVLDSIEQKGELLARKGTPENRTHYIHVEILGSEYWNNHILFRNYLLEHPEYIEKYQKIKNKAYDLYQGERKKYTAEKNNFIQDVLTRAKNEK